MMNNVKIFDEIERSESIASFKSKNRNEEVANALMCSLPAICFGAVGIAGLVSYCTSAYVNKNKKYIDTVTPTSKEQNLYNQSMIENSNDVVKFINYKIKNVTKYGIDEINLDANTLKLACNIDYIDQIDLIKNSNEFDDQFKDQFFFNMLLLKNYELSLYRTCAENTNLNFYFIKKQINQLAK